MLVAIFALGLAPLLVAWMLRAAATAGQFATTNRGAWLRPPLVLAEFVVQPLEGAGHWQVLLVGEPCAAACAQAWARLVTLPTLLGADGARVAVARLPVGDGARALPAAVAHGALIADPLGNIILHYRYNQAGGDLLADLRHLLKYSSAG